MERSPENNVSVFKIICTYFISLFLFVVVQSVSCVVLTLIVSLLASIPVIGSIVARTVCSLLILLYFYSIV